MEIQNDARRFSLDLKNTVMQYLVQQQVEIGVDRQKAVQQADKEVAKLDRRQSWDDIDNLLRKAGDANSSTKQHAPLSASSGRDLTRQMGARCVEGGLGVTLAYGA